MQTAGLMTIRPPSVRYGVGARLLRGVRSESRAGVDCALIFGPAQCVRLVLELFGPAPTAVHQNHNCDVLRMRRQAHLHDVLARMEAPDGARAVVGSEGICDGAGVSYVGGAGDARGARIRQPEGAMTVKVRL